MQGCEALLIDEASMMKCWNVMLRHEVYAGRCIVIFVGDDKQINLTRRGMIVLYFLGKPPHTLWQVRIH
jgi:hypothetical protein